MFEMNFIEHQYRKTVYNNHENLYFPNCQGKYERRHKTHDKILPVRSLVQLMCMCVCTHMSTHAEFQLVKHLKKKIKTWRVFKNLHLKRARGTCPSSQNSPKCVFHQTYVTVLKNENTCHKENRNVEAFLQAEWRYDWSLRKGENIHRSTRAKS